MASMHLISMNVGILSDQLCLRSCFFLTMPSELMTPKLKHRRTYYLSKTQAKSVDETCRGRNTAFRLGFKRQPKVGYGRCHLGEWFSVEIQARHWDLQLGYSPPAKIKETQC
jgi:hypothetical protein